MPLLDPRHDLAHVVEGDSAWSESYYFNAYDEPSSSGLFTRIGVRPNEGTMDVGLSVWLPDGDLAEYRSVREQHEAIDTILEVGDVRYEMIEPMKTWRLSSDCEVKVRSCVKGSQHSRTVHLSLDLTFEAVSGPVGTDGSPRGPQSAEAKDASGATGKGHFEQSGRYHGFIEVNGARFTWTAAHGNRDRSWGPRRWGGPTMWRWFSINIGDDLHFGGIRLGTPSGDLHRGWVWKDGRATSIANWGIRTELEDDDFTQKVVHLEVLDKKGNTYNVRGDVMRVADIGTGFGTVVNEGLTRWTYADPAGTARTGYGVAEYLSQIDDNGRPVILVE